MRKSVKLAVVASAMVAIVGTGVAFAAWNATGSGSAYSKAGTAQGLSTVDIHAQAAGQLYPGVNGDVIVKRMRPTDLSPPGREPEGSRH